MKTILIISITIICFSCKKEESASSNYLSEEKQIFKTGLWYNSSEVIRGTFQPTVVSTNKGTVMIFAQGRLNNSEDDTHKTLLFSRSTDEGKTWSTPSFLIKPAEFWGVCAHSYIDESNTETIAAMFVISKPKLFDRYSSAELLENFNINTNDFKSIDASFLYQLKSIDDGLSWKGEVVNEDFMNTYNDEGQFISFFSPVGQMNTISEGPYKGRIMACGPVAYANEPIDNPDDIYDYKKTTSTIIYSDDNGQSWRMGGLAPLGGNESSAVSVNGGNEILMIRRRNNYPTKRIANYSSDGGITWSDNELIQDIPSPKCLGVALDDGNKLIYSTPKTTLRTKGWIGCSYDDGKTWTGKIIENGLFSYSDIEHIKNTDKYIVTYSLVHHGELGLNARIFNEAWLP